MCKPLSYRSLSVIETQSGIMIIIIMLDAVIVIKMDLSSSVQQETLMQINSQATDSSVSDVQAQSSVCTTVQANPGE